MNDSIPNGSNEVCKEVIWNNKYILFSNEMVFNNTLISSGIIYINDLLTKEGKFSVEGTLGASITHNDYIKLLGIIHAIPRNWKNQITSQTIVENRGRGIGSNINGTFLLLRKMYIDILLIEIVSLQCAKAFSWISTILLKMTIENYLCFPGKQLLTLGMMVSI